MRALINFEELFARKISHIQVRGEGVVTAILNDDLEGRKHQRFVLELTRHKTLLILNNIDIFPRLEGVEIGDRVEFFGEYIWNRHGGAVHWTHPDPRGKRDHGYVKIVTDALEDEADFDNAAANRFPLGVYRHESGRLYELIGFAHSYDSGELLVIYKALYGDKKVWAYPAEKWQGFVEYEDNTEYNT